ncbi:MAG: universal stress protein [Deltaproteobacteria bacterium]|nr:universal stress protein [Deltaproteobacteria bacterium]
MSRTILVAHDFAPCADAAARLALRDLLAGGSPGTLVLCNVYTIMPMPLGLDGAAGVGAGLVELERAVALETQKRLERAAATLRADHAAMRTERPGLPDVTVTAALRQDAPAEGVVAEAVARGAERIYVGTHGRTGITHVLLGSVAERIARLAKVPVTVVKTDT